MLSPILLEILNATKHRLVQKAKYDKELHIDFILVSADTKTK